MNGKEGGCVMLGLLCLQAIEEKEAERAKSRSRPAKDGKRSAKDDERLASADSKDDATANGSSEKVTALQLVPEAPFYAEDGCSCLMHAPAIQWLATALLLTLRV